MTGVRGLGVVGVGICLAWQLVPPHLPPHNIPGCAEDAAIERARPGVLKQRHYSQRAPGRRVSSSTLRRLPAFEAPVSPARKLHEAV